MSDSPLRRSGRKRKAAINNEYDWNSDQEDQKPQKKKYSSPQPSNSVSEKKTPRKQKLILSPLQQMEPVIESFSPNKKKNLPPKLRSKKIGPSSYKINIDVIGEVNQEQKEFMEEMCSKFSHVLSTNAKKFMIYEWFYSVIDYHYFSKNEFEDCLHDLNLSHIEKLTRYEWNQIRNAIGKPRRFSANFLKNEKEKLEINRNRIRKKMKNILNIDDRVMVYTSQFNLEIGVIKSIELSKYVVELESTKSNVKVVDSQIMSLTPNVLTAMDSNINTINMAHFVVKLRKKEKILKELNEMNDKFENKSELESDFSIKYAWLIVQLRELNTTIDQYKMIREVEPEKKKIESKYNLTFESNRIAASKLFEHLDSKVKNVIIQCVGFLFHLKSCIDNVNFNKNDVEVTMNAALMAMKPKFGNEMIYQEIKEFIQQIKKILLE
eukprot:gene10307-2724_t